MTAEGVLEDTKPVDIYSDELSEDILAIRKHVENIWKQVDVITANLSTHDNQAKSDFGILKSDMLYLRGNVEKTQICLTDVNEVLDKLASISSNNTRAIGDAAASIKDLAVVLSANSEKRETFYQQEITSKRQATIDEAEATRKMEADKIKARDIRRLKWIAIIGGIVTVIRAIVVIVVDRLIE